MNRLRLYGLNPSIIYNKTASLRGPIAMLHVYYYVANCYWYTYVYYVVEHDWNMYACETSTMVRFLRQYVAKYDWALARE